jgi:hypothetical protein
MIFCLFQFFIFVFIQIANGEIKGLPKAKEMLELQWDESLEKEAQRKVGLSFVLRQDNPDNPN